VPGVRFNDVHGMEVGLNLLLSIGEEEQQLAQDRGLEWVRRRAPEDTWERVFDAALEVVPLTTAARALRQERAVAHAN
jgi:hypothetical protein